MGNKIVPPADRKEIREYLQHINQDPGYQALRLRGLAALLRTSDLEEPQPPEVAFFLATTLDEIAGALDGDD